MSSRHPMLGKGEMIWIPLMSLLLGMTRAELAASTQESLRDAVALGRTRDSALYSAFHAGYVLAASGEVESVELITEFRRAVMIVREHADAGEYSFNENNLARAMAPYQGLVTFIARL